ncbi:MAG: hypothetical protein AB1625_08240 [Acidobacteriota bacterium]
MRSALASVLGLVVPAVAAANFCARDVVPAATLLVPYVAVALTPEGAPDPEGQTTITQIVNVSPKAVVVHFTVWDVAGVPRLTFDAILSGYDVMRINWRDFLNGRFDLFDTSKEDLTATPYRTFSPFSWGPDMPCMISNDSSCVDPLTVPQNRTAVSAARCPTVPPYGNRMDLAAMIRNLLRAATVARESAGCNEWDMRRDKRAYPAEIAPSPMVFYVTADVVGGCTLGDPTSAAYWTDSARTDNVLIGDVIYLSPEGNRSEMMPAVHIEAAAGEGGGASVTGFGEERSGGAETFREPLATAFGFSYADDRVAGISSSLVLWKNVTELTAADVPEQAAWAPYSDCGSYVYYAWDMDERVLALQFAVGYEDPGLDPNQFPLATQKVPIERSYFDLPAPYGWLLLVLPPSYAATFADRTPDGRGWTERPAMGWVGVMTEFGAYSAGAGATTMANTHCHPEQVLPALGANPGSAPVR